MFVGVCTHLHDDGAPPRCCSPVPRISSFFFTASVERRHDGCFSFFLCMKNQNYLFLHFQHCHCLCNVVHTQISISLSTNLFYSVLCSWYHFYIIKVSVTREGTSDAMPVERWISLFLFIVYSPHSHKLAFNSFIILSIFNHDLHIKILSFVFFFSFAARDY